MTAKVYVTASRPFDGFTDSDSKARLDTAKDVASALVGRGFRLVHKAADANVIIEIVDRHVEDARDSGAVALPNRRAVAVVPTRAEVRIIRAGLSVAGTIREFRAWGGTSWSTLAKTMAKDIGTWLAENEAQLQLGGTQAPAPTRDVSAAATRRPTVGALPPDPWSLPPTPIEAALTRDATSPADVVNRFVQSGPVTIIPCKTFVEVERLSPPHPARTFLAFWIRGFVDGSGRVSGTPMIWTAPSTP